ncbi:hypothetical protein [Corallibacter sp.]|uniref:hypothetical protein n=1 Tax=Corallibacter sp. TaxID=2038084 RepID=UPI003A8D3410
MKNLGTLLLGIILGVLGYYFFCGTCCGDVGSPPPITKPQGLITSSQAQVLSSAYNMRYELVSDSVFGGPNLDNRSSWYSVDDIKNYLIYADSQSTALGYTMNGLRVYLGAQQGSKKMPGYTTMFFVPTGESTSSPTKGGKNDIPGGDGLDYGGEGHPPSATYPQ